MHGCFYFSKALSRILRKGIWDIVMTFALKAIHEYDVNI